MDSLFKNLTKGTIAVLAIGGGIILLVLFDPPHTICNSQAARFNDQQVGLLLKDPKIKSQQIAPFEADLNRCKQTNTPGGCYELFRKMKTVLQSVDAVEVNCLPDLGGQSIVKKFFNNSIDLIAQLAWGGKPPEAATLKFGWLDSSDLNLFCQLKERYILTFGNEAYQSKVEKAFTELPGSKGLPRDQAWQLMLYSTNCRSYL